MAVERVQWQCPQCDRRYAIPSHLPKPELCPKCQVDDERYDAIASAEDPSKKRRPPDSTTINTPNVTFPPAPAEPPDLRPAAVETAADDRTWLTARYRRKYPALQTISFIYKCFAVFVFLASIAGFVYAIVSMVGAEGQSQRWNAAMLGMGALAGGVFGGVTLLASSELIRVLLDIERNTRRR